MIYESEYENYTWGKHKGWLLTEICKGNEDAFCIMQEGFLEILNHVEEELEVTFPGADFTTLFDKSTASRYLDLHISVSREYFERLWNIRVDAAGGVYSDDIPKLDDKKELVNYLGYYGGGYTFLSYVKIGKMPVVMVLVDEYNVKLAPYNVKFRIADDGECIRGQRWGKK